ncbi:MAG TPA: thioredoxin family protein [Anaerolineaceae bacterium]|jgi:glutaredoxin-like protein
MPQLLNDQVQRQVRSVFKDLQNPVQVLFFGRQTDCEYCDDTRQLLEEVTALSDQLGLTVYDLDADAAVAGQYQIDKAPGFAILAREGEKLTDFGIRIYGIPSGHEFTTLVNDLVMVSARSSGLSEETIQYLREIKSPLHLQVFTTPTCPYCPRAVVLAHQLAMENPLITAEMVESYEFPDLSERYAVSGVPQTTINKGVGTVVGAVPESYLLDEIKRVLAELASAEDRR